jgi:hypothetical protein
VIQGQLLWTTPNTNLSMGGAQIWARPLTSSTVGEAAWAVHFLNAGSSAVELTCDQECFAAMGGVPAGSQVEVRDLWSHSDLPSLASGADLVVSDLAALGGSRLFRLTWMTSTQQEPRE